MIVLSLLLLVITLFIIFVKKKQNYWRDRNVPQMNPAFLFGNLINVMLKKENFQTLLNRMYNNHPNSRYEGVYQAILPTLLIKDPELLKQMIVKDFDHFMDHHLFVPRRDPLWGRNLVALNGKAWQDMRSTLSPAFTSSKLKCMFPLMSECAEKFIDYFLKMNKTVVSIELKEEFSRFANDVIATCAFGVSCNTIEERTNIFMEMGKRVSVLPSFKFFGTALFPGLFHKLGITLFDPEVGDFFKNIVMETIKVREEQRIERPDMIHLLMQAKAGILDGDGDKPPKTAIKNEDIVGQVLIFFLAGFDSISTQMTFSAYELALNQDVQDKVFAEIVDGLERNDQKIDYEMIQSLKYLDMVMMESLRKWPATGGGDRLCVKDYKIPAKLPGEKDIIIEKGTPIWLPISAINRDPKYFPDPDRFDPERFSEANKDKIVAGTLLAFGFGPRACIGSRFAIMEMKIMLVNLLKTFKLVKVDKTQDVIKLSSKSLNNVMDGGHWIGLQRRN
ncbi:PREDICTED: cytochrome P450 9e2-like [Nicrophorus vespilloides]|uniref:Cytochrome P450 9e2-like n=1 Tax=Nicrophorus vespilloides TaxID=110193 RepID=A0ABM1MS31_NICVS|nr:PREDICTED: cytochrome P450 9e2-like [Nicrophorus vespilloides]